MTATLERPLGIAEMADDIRSQHDVALQQSIDQEQMGYPPEVEVPIEVTMPRLITHDAMAAMGIQRRLHNRELAHHPLDPTKMIITGLKQRLTY